MTSVRFVPTDKEKAEIDKTEQLNLEDITTESQSNGLFDSLDPDDGMFLFDICIPMQQFGTIVLINILSYFHGLQNLCWTFL